MEIELPNKTEGSANDLDLVDSAQMRTLLQQSRQRLSALCRNFSAHPDMQVAVHRLMNLEDILGGFSEMAVKNSELMRLVLQASVTALVNLHAVETVDAELKRRAAPEN